MVGTSNQSVPEMAIDIMFGQNKKDGIPWRYIFPILLKKNRPRDHCCQNSPTGSWQNHGAIALIYLQDMGVSENVLYPSNFMQKMMVKQEFFGTSQLSDRPIWPFDG